MSIFAERAQDRLIELVGPSSDEICDYNLALRENGAWLFKAFVERHPSSAYTPAAEQVLSGFQTLTFAEGAYVTFDSLRSSLGWNGERTISCGSLTQTVYTGKDGTQTVSYSGGSCIGNMQMRSSVSVEGDGFRFLTDTDMWRQASEVTPTFSPSFTGDSDRHARFVSNSEFHTAVWQIHDGEYAEPEEQRTVRALECLGYGSDHHWHSVYRSTWGYSRARTRFPPGSLMIIFDDGFEDDAMELVSVFEAMFPEFEISSTRRGSQPDFLSFNVPYGKDIVVAISPLGDGR
jgi:hypothetical protein